MTQSSLPKLLSPTHVAERLDCSLPHIYGLIAAGRLRAEKIKATGTRSKTRIRDDDLIAFIEANTRTPPPRGER